MKIIFSLFKILAIELPSLRISPLLAFVLVGTGTFLVDVMYIQSIGSGLTSFGDLFIFSLVPIKPKRLTNLEKSQFTLSDELKQILVGLMLGDLCAQNRSSNGNVRLLFKQGIVHKDYIMHLYEIFSGYCSSVPKFTNAAPDKRTGVVYTGIFFNTYSLPCFNELYNLFYPEGKKIIPNIIGDLLTPLSLSYWICDDGGWAGNSTRLHTNSFTLEEVNLLAQVLSDKFDLKVGIHKNGSGSIIRVSTKSMPVLQELLKDKIPSMMRHKIGL